MYSDDDLLRFNNQVAQKRLVWWELHSSEPGHDQDELFLQFEDGSVTRIVAEHRTVGAAVKIEPHSRLPVGRTVRNLPAEYNARGRQVYTPTASQT